MDPWYGGYLAAARRSQRGVALSAGSHVKLLVIKKGLRRRMHRPIPEQGAWLKKIVTGYFNYHAVPTNSRALCVFRTEVTRRWIRVLRRRRNCEAAATHA